MAQRIVIIDDDADSCEMLADMLRLDGHQVWSAGTGQTGISSALAHDASVVICDILLPDLSGLEVARQLSAQRAGGILCIALTGYTRQEDCDASLAAGFAAHLSKPVNFERLEQLLKAPPRAQAVSAISKAEAGSGA